MFISELTAEQLKIYKQYVYDCLVKAANPSTHIPELRGLTVTNKSFCDIHREMFNEIMNFW